MTDVQKLRRACDSCPWRVDAPREYWDPQHFVDIYANCQDDGLHIMLCHKSNVLPKESRADVPCQGWIRVMGYEAIGVRLLIARGRATIEEVEDTEGPELFPSFEAMLRANRVAPPDRRRWKVPVQRG